MWIIAVLSIFVAISGYVSAAVTTTVDCSTEANQVKLHAHPTSCTQYMQCVHGLPMARPCATGTEFSPSIGVCVHPWQSDCTAEKESNVTEATVVSETTKIPEQVEPEEVVTEKVEPEEIVTEKVEPEEVVTEKVEPEEIVTGKVEPEEVVTEKVEPEEIVTGKVEPEEVVTEKVEPEELVTEKVITEKVEPEEVKEEEEGVTEAVTTQESEQEDKDTICGSNAEVVKDETCNPNIEVTEKSDTPENNEECEEESDISEKPAQPQINTTQKSVVSESPSTTVWVKESATAEESNKTEEKSASKTNQESQASSNGYLYPNRFEPFDPNNLCGDGVERLPIDANSNCHFIICTGGISLSLRCPLGQYFDSHIGQCIQGQGNCADE